MPAVGAHDAFETEYTKRLVAVLAGHGLPVEYDKDRAAVDAALHMYVEGNRDRQVSHTRVWFQAKGKRASTLSADTFYAADHVAVRVPVDHLKFWYAAPEAVYLVVYVEAVDQFLAEDVRDIVERMWPHGEFYASVPITQKDVTVHVRTDALLDTDAFKRMLRHRSIRADGPAFRGRPLGHRFDPIRSQIDVCESELFYRIVGRLLAAHGFRGASDLSGV